LKRRWRIRRATRLRAQQVAVLLLLARGGLKVLHREVARAVVALEALLDVVERARFGVDLVEPVGEVIQRRRRELDFLART